MNAIKGDFSRVSLPCGLTALLGDINTPVMGPSHVSQRVCLRGGGNSSAPTDYRVSTGHQRSSEGAEGPPPPFWVSPETCPLHTWEKNDSSCIEGSRQGSCLQMLPCHCVATTTAIETRWRYRQRWHMWATRGTRGRVLVRLRGIMLGPTVRARFTFSLKGRSKAPRKIPVWLPG